ADPLCQSGQRAGAQERFREAEALLAAIRPQTRLLYSLQGYQYCDLLMTEAERFAWRTVLELKNRNLALVTAAACCRTVSKRALQTLKWNEQRGVLFDIA